MSAALARLAEVLVEQGGLTAGLLAEPREEPGPGAGGSSIGEGSPYARLAGSGPRTAAAAADYELVVETIYEGYLLHYGTPRVARAAEEDLGLLVGDQLYALGLARLVALGDLEAVSELADVISLSALAQAAGRDELAHAVWAAGARAVAWGAAAEHERAKELLRAGAPEALAAMEQLAAS